MTYQNRMDMLRASLKENDIATAIITDDDNVYYLTGYYDYLHMDFGRPTILIVPQDGPSFLITPTMEAVMAEDAAQVDRMKFWNDGQGDEWRGPLLSALPKAGRIGLEPDLMPPVVRACVDSAYDSSALVDATPILMKLRMVKSPEELSIARHAGLVAMAMMEAGAKAIGHDVPEYEVALATSRAGTLKAAELLSAHYSDANMSPNTHFLQIIASGKQITKPHHRASTRRMQRGEPVFLCFCGMTNFNRFKLGFDRTFWIGEVEDESQIAVYETALASQTAALEVLRPGVTAESVHAAYANVIQEAGYEYPFRCGRATGYSFLERPQLVFGDQTVLEPGMVFAVDGSVSAGKSFRAQVGDSFIITENGYEKITDGSKDLKDVILPC